MSSTKQRGERQKTQTYRRRTDWCRKRVLSGRRPQSLQFRRASGAQQTGVFHITSRLHEMPKVTIAAYDDGTSHVVLSPMEFIGRLAALVPKPRVNLTRFHGVFSPNSRLREHVVPTKPADGKAQVSPSAINKVYSMTWAQRLKRVFKGRPSASKSRSVRNAVAGLKIIASIEQPIVIEKILKHLGLDEASQARNRSAPEGLFPHSTKLF